MDKFELIKNFFESIKCSQCDKFFTKDSIHLVRKEESAIVVRIVCSHCEKNLGLAILGIDENEYKNSLKFQNKLEEAYPMEGIMPDTPITYDEVAEAHKFFTNLGADWAKYLPKKE